MHSVNWCEHADKVSKFSVVRYDFHDRKTILRVQTWFCPECGIHGSDTEIVEQKDLNAGKNTNSHEIAG